MTCCEKMKKYGELYYKGNPGMETGFDYCPWCGVQIFQCSECEDTGFLFGAQNWSDNFIKKNGTPYYTALCGCENAKEKRVKFKKKEHGK